MGLLTPITLDQHSTLVAGLHRLEAAKLLGWTEIECTAIGMDTVQHDEQIEAASMLAAGTMESVEQYQDKCYPTEINFHTKSD